MKRFDDSKIMLLLLAFVLTLMLAATSANADFTFGAPTNLGPTVNSSGNEGGPSISADGLSLFFTSGRPPGGFGNFELWVTTRETKNAEWGQAVHLGSTVNSNIFDLYPSISADGLSLFFTQGTFWDTDLWVSTRPNIGSSWGSPINLGPAVNSSSRDVTPCISADGLSLYFGSERPGGLGDGDLWVTTRPSVSDPWGTPSNLGAEINSLYQEGWPSISVDGLILFFCSGDSETAGGGPRPGGFGNGDIWMARRAAKDGDWSHTVNLEPLINSPADEASPSVSADGSTLYFDSARAGGFGNRDIWQAPILPTLDFNGDGIVDMKDFSKLAQHWLQNERLVDIAPPIGNGIVDIRDVAVLADYWLKEIGLIAHCELDETEGDIAHERINHRDGSLHAGPVWQPTGGKIDGALQLDGVDDYVSTPFVLNPADGAFSVFAWVKGVGGPGQVIISQQNGVNWLATDPFNFGWLITDLQASGRFGHSLFSQTVITDGNWHRVGLTWDGSKNRILYVDDVEAAKDTQAELVGSDGGLYFGAGKGLEAGSFWSGLIDDIKIYDRALTP